MPIVREGGDIRGEGWFETESLKEVGADLIRMRTREGMAIARASGKLHGKQSELSVGQQRELSRMHATGEYSISDLDELFSVRKTNRLSHTQPAIFPLAYDSAPYRSRPASGRFQ